MGKGLGFSEEEIRIIRDNFLEVGARGVVKLLGGSRSEGSISSKACKLGITPAPRKKKVPIQRKEGVEKKAEVKKEEVYSPMRRVEVNSYTTRYERM